MEALPIAFFFRQLSSINLRFVRAVASYLTASLIWDGSIFHKASQQVFYWNRYPACLGDPISVIP